MVCGSGFMADTGLGRKLKHGFRRGTVDGINVIEICLPYSNYDCLTKRACTFLNYSLLSIGIALQEKYDLLFATSTPLTAGLPGIFMRVLKPRSKFVFEVRDLWPELPKAMGVVTNPMVVGALWALEQISYASMTAGVALSPGIKQGMQKMFGCRKKITMVPNGCDLNLFKPVGIDLIQRKKKLFQIPKKGLRCIFTGAHGVANGLDAVLDAAKILKERKRTDIHLLFIGDGRLKPHLKQRTAEEVLDNCIFLDPIPKIELAQLLQDVDVGMMILKNVPAFYYGTSPNKFFDFISSGLPVLNNYPGWLAEVIVDNACGIAVPPDDPTAFADALIHMADNPIIRKQMSRNSRKLATNQFSRDQLADRLITFLENVVKKKHETHSSPNNEIGS